MQTNLAILPVASVWFAQVHGLCHKATEIDETCGLKAQYFGNPSIKPATTPEIFDDNCKVMHKAFDCLKDYNAQCVEGISQQVGKTVLHQGHSHIEEVCGDADRKAEFIEHNQCFADADKFQQFVTCTDRWHHMTDQAKNIPPELLIPSGCCIFHELQACVHAKNVELCHDKNAAYWEGTLDEVSNDSIDAFCSNFKTKEECDKNFPAEHWKTIMAAVEGMDAATLRTRPRFKSAFFAIIDQFGGHKI